MTQQQLAENPMTRDEAAQRLGLKVFDYALPQPWVNAFVQETGLDYWLVLSTTFWSYDRTKYFGEPVSICEEVQTAITNLQKENVRCPV